MTRFALSAIGRDRPGIVAGVSGVLVRHGLNIEDSQMTILGGHFTMTLIVAAGEGLDRAALGGDLDRIRDELGLEALALSEVEELEQAGRGAASHIASVYGADHPGIVHAVTSALAERGVNITDLETRLTGGADVPPLYVMLMELALPEALSAEDLEAALGAVAEEQGVDVTVRRLEPEIL